MFGYGAESLPNLLVGAYCPGNMGVCKCNFTAMNSGILQEFNNGSLQIPLMSNYLTKRSTKCRKIFTKGAGDLQLSICMLVKN